MTRPAIIVSHGQPSDPDPQQEAIEGLARDVSRASARRVIGATLAKPGALEAALKDAPDALVFPMFMAEGWFTGTELPRRLSQAGGTGFSVLRPFGVDPALPDLCRRTVTGAARNDGREAAEITLLLIAHGSKRARGSAHGTEAMAEKLRKVLGHVVTGFIEEAPFLVDVARGLGPGAIALPFFATRAEHVTDDIPEALAEADFKGRCLAPIGLSPEVPALVAAALDRGDSAIASAPSPA